MNKKLMECLMSPVKCKLLFEIHTCGQTTAKHLSETYADIPQATLYRHLKKMTADGIIKIAEQNQIRGALENTYAIAVDLNEGKDDIVVKNSGEAYFRMFNWYMLGFMKQFQEYCKREDINIVNDKSGFTTAPMYVTDEELMDCLAQITQIIEPMSQNKAENGRQLRTIGLIISPPEKMQ